MVVLLQAMIFVVASNAFNSLNGLATSHNTEYFCPVAVLIPNNTYPNVHGWLLMASAFCATQPLELTNWLANSVLFPSSLCCRLKCWESRKNGGASLQLLSKWFQDPLTHQAKQVRNVKGDVLKTKEDTSIKSNRYYGGTWHYLFS